MYFCVARCPRDNFASPPWDTRKYSLKSLCPLSWIRVNDFASCSMIGRLRDVTLRIHSHGNWFDLMLCLVVVVRLERNIFAVQFRDLGCFRIESFSSLKMPWSVAGFIPKQAYSNQLPSCFQLCFVLLVSLFFLNFYQCNISMLIGF